MGISEEEAERLERARKGDFDYRKVHVKDLPVEITELYKGELYYRPIVMVIGGLTDDDPPKIGSARIDSSGRFDIVSSPYVVGQGAIRLVSGEFTKDVTATTGTLIVTPDVDDVIYFLYGIVTIGSTHAGAASPLYAGISGSNTHPGIVQSHLQDDTADADEVFRFPGLGAATTAAATTSGVYHSLQTAIMGANLITLEAGTAGIVGNPRYIVVYETMADTETFEASLYFLSVKNTAVTAAVLTGAWA